MNFRLEVTVADFAVYDKVGSAHVCEDHPRSLKGFFLQAGLQYKLTKQMEMLGLKIVSCG